MEWRSGVVIVLLLMGLLVLSGEVEQSEGAVACSTVNQDIAGCIAYARGMAPKPAYNSVCCKGVRALDALCSMSRENRQNICVCIENAAKVLKPDPQAVSSLPDICGANNSFSLSENCTTVP